MPYAAPIPTTPKSENNSVPPGHRTKCRKCGAVDKTKIVGTNRRLIRCAYCGGTVARRRAPRQPKIISYVVLTQHDGVNLPPVKRVDLFSAESYAITFAERGPVARVRIAQIVELCDDKRTGNVRQLRYDNYKGRRASMVWTNGCEPCKGRGVVAERIPARNGDKPTIKFVPCSVCHALGGELTREVNYKRLRPTL